MQTQTAIAYRVLADALCYPAPGQLNSLAEGLAEFPEGGAKLAFSRFLAMVGRLSLAEWEELHTRTLDLNPPAAPYIGFQTWGESYQRGAFLATMNRVLMETGVDLEGELPDHLTPVFRYLGHTTEPLPQLVEVLPTALKRILAGLRNTDPANPYVNLFEAAQELCQAFTREAV